VSAHSINRSTAFLVVTKLQADVTASSFSAIEQDRQRDRESNERGGDR
jgi:hypothetical protein